MATFVTDEKTAAGVSVRSLRSPSGATSAAVAKWLGGLVVLTGVVALVAYGSRAFLSSDDGGGIVRLTHEVATGDLIITVTEDGNLESAANLDIKCEVAGGSSILWIVEDGKVVEKGEKLIELDQAALEDQISQQKITYEKARSAMIQAEKDYSVAKISVEEYLEGTFKKELQDAEAQITIAEENLRSARNALEHSQRMFRRGYISSLELESQQFSVQRAQLELDSANTAMEVLTKFTRVKTLEDLNSQVETAQARMESERAAFALEEARLNRLNAQLANCVIHAPAAGMVVYANERSRNRFAGGNTPQIAEGAQVRERQNILVLPDLEQMQVKTNVHESKVDSLSAGMPARITIQGQIHQGRVTAIANQPEQDSWFSGNVKEYATSVKIDGEPKGLKPGMTAEVEILIANLQDVVTVPVAAVVEQRGKFYAWVLEGAEPQRRELLLGLSNDQFVEVKDGLAVGQHVLLNPRAAVAEARGGDTRDEDEEANVDERFGERAGDAAAEAGRNPARQSRGGGPDQDAAPGGRGGRRGGGGRGGFNPMQFDADGDGRVTREEAPEQMQAFFDRLDGNGDGAIDADEISAMRGRRGQGGPPEN